MSWWTNECLDINLLMRCLLLPHHLLKMLPGVVDIRSNEKRTKRI